MVGIHLRLKASEKQMEITQHPLIWMATHPCWTRRMIPRGWHPLDSFQMVFNGSVTPRKIKEHSTREEGKT